MCQEKFQFAKRDGDERKKEKKGDVGRGADIL
jgi:hypothetical protein